jgi:hypothetical protein
MPTIHHPPDTDPPPPPPYFRVLPAPDWAAIDAVLAEMGMPPAA